MYQVELTSYGESIVSGSVLLEQVVLLNEYIPSIETLVDISGYTILLQTPACGNNRGKVASITILDVSSSEYSARTILFLSTVSSSLQVVAGYSQESPLIKKGSNPLNLFIPLDFSVFVNGFSFPFIQAGFSAASENIDGLVHIENPDTEEDPTVTTYNKSQADSLALQSVKDAHSLVMGTQTSTTYLWTGTLNRESLYVGLVINYFLPVSSSSSTYATLTLTLSGGTQTDSIPIYYRGTNRVTNQFPAGSVLQLTYLENITVGSITIAKGWFTNSFYYQTDYNYYDRLRVDFRVYADTGGIYGGQLLLHTGENKYTSICTSYTTNTTKTPTSLGFYLDSILFYSYTTTITQGNTVSTESLYRVVEFDVRYSFNVSSLVQNKPVYLKVTYEVSDRKFYIDPDSAWWSQELPDDYDGYYYIYLGVMYSTTLLVLDVNHPIYTYADDYYYSGIKEVTAEHFLNDYVTLSTEQGIAANKIILGNKKLYLSPTKKAYLGDNNITLIDGQLSFSESETANTESILMASVLQDNSLEIKGSLLPQPYGSTANSTYSLGATNATFKEGHIRTLYGNVGDASNSYNVYASYLYFGSYTDDTGTSVSTNMHLWNNVKGGIDVTGNMNPSSSNRYNLGSTTYKWKEVNAVSFKGNATTASALESSVNLDGKAFDGSASITHYVRCNSAAADVSKVVDCPGFELVDGARLSVYFVNTNSATNPTLKIRTSTSPETFLPEKVISIYGSNGMNSQSYNTWRGGSIIGLVYDATTQYWIWEGYMRYTYRSDSATYDTSAQSIVSTYIKTIDLVNYAGTVIDSGSSSSGSDCTWGGGVITASKYPTHIRITKGNSSTRTYISIAALVASSLIGFSRTSSSGSLSPYGAIGSVAILMVQRSSNSTVISRGTIIDSASTLVARGIVANSTSGDLSWSSGASGTVSGTWVALNYTGTSSGGYNYCMVLAIRIL